jgi:hypothetical protein
MKETTKEVWNPKTSRGATARLVLLAMLFCLPTTLAAQRVAGSDTTTSIVVEFDQPMPSRTAFQKAIAEVVANQVDVSGDIIIYNELRQDPSQEARHRAMQVLGGIAEELAGGIEAFAPAIRRVLDVFDERTDAITELEQQVRHSAEMALESAERADSMAAAVNLRSIDIRAWAKAEKICNPDPNPEECPYELQVLLQKAERDMGRAEQLIKDAADEHQEALKSMDKLRRIREDMRQVQLAFLDVHAKVTFWAEDVHNAVRRQQELLMVEDITRGWTGAQGEMVGIMASFHETTRGIRTLFAGGAEVIYDGLDERLRAEITNGEVIERRAQQVRARTDSLRASSPLLAGRQP